MRSAKAVILGGGVIGLSTAYHLARKRFGQVIVLEKGSVGDGSSSRAAGIITGLLPSETAVRVRKRCFELYRELSFDLEGYHFRNTGCLNLIAPDAWPPRQGLLPLYDRLHVPYEVLDTAEVRTRWPRLQPREEVVGLFDPLGGYSEPSEYLPALKRRVQRLGVDVREFVKVTGLETRSGRVVAVRTEDHLLDADAVICTVHSWTRVLLETSGLQLPVKNFVHQRYVSHAVANRGVFPAVNANPWGCYFRPAGADCLLAGIETADREEFQVDSLDFHQSELSASPQLKQQLIQDLQGVIPMIKNVRWGEEKIGLLSFSMDGEPICGPVKELAGLFVAAAFHSGGFAYNPAVGELLAEFVAEGQTRIDVTAFAPDRFNPAKIAQYLEEKFLQRDVARRRH